MARGHSEFSYSSISCTRKNSGVHSGSRTHRASGLDHWSHLKKRTQGCLLHWLGGKFSHFHRIRRLLQVSVDLVLHTNHGQLFTFQNPSQRSPILPPLQPAAQLRGTAPLLAQVAHFGLSLGPVEPPRRHSVRPRSVGNTMRNMVFIMMRMISGQGKTFYSI